MNDQPAVSREELIAKIRDYWNARIHDLEIVKHPVGSEGFFKDLDEYRFDKLNYLPKVVDFSGFAGKKFLEVGCGCGIDLVRFAQGGAKATGIDLSKTAIDLAREYFRIRNLPADLKIMDGEAMTIPDSSFDVVYAHGVLQYTADAQRMADEILRVLKPGGQFIGMVYNKKGWLIKLSKIFKVELEHEDAPVLNTYTIREFKNMLSGFSKVKILPERFPVKSRLHKGFKGFLYNTFFVGLFRWVPKPLVRRSGWHLMAFAVK
jgi:SAM-dependent methyltransferase